MMYFDFLNISLTGFVLHIIGLVKKAEQKYNILDKTSMKASNFSFFVKEKKLSKEILIFFLSLHRFLINKI